ncbi:MAG: glycosyltransferase family 39 protein [Cryomorphaceae bacterium]
MEFFSKYRHLSWVLLLVPIYAFLFVKLGAFHIRLWDEGWFVVHAYEMLERGSLLVPYYNGEAVFYGSKPPLQTWLQMVFIKAIGYNELAVRLPSAIAAGLTVLLIFHWVRKVSSESVAWMAALFMLTIDGFVHFHTARGGEADALLTLTIIAQVYFFWNWLTSKQKKALWGLAAMIAISFWVKNVAGFMMLPGFLMYLLLYDRRSLIDALKAKETYLIIGTGVLGGLSYLLVRELAQPGHMSFLIGRQAGRLVNDVGHDQPIDYYFNRLKDERLRMYLPFAMVAVFLPFFKKDPAAKPFQFASTLTLVYFLLISIARSKLEWYLMPIYPLIGVSLGYLVSLAITPLKAWQKAILIALLFAWPCHVMLRKTQENKIDMWSKYYEMEEQYLFNAYNEGRNIDGLNVVHDHFDGALLFYKYKFKIAGQHINLQNNLDLKVGELALVDSDKHKKEIDSLFVLDTLDQLENVYLFEIISKKTVLPKDSSVTPFETQVIQP